MRGTLISLTIIVLATTWPAWAESDNRPILRAKAASVELQLQPSGRRLLRLPNLDFVLQIEPHCGVGMHIASVSISIADTSKSFRGMDFLEQSTLETTIRLPRRQIGPLAIVRFCTGEDKNSNNDDVLLIRDAFTAHVSLRCADGVRELVVYETLALAIRMVCKAPGHDKSDAIADQESSVSSTRLRPKNSRVRIQASSAASAL